MIDNIKDTTKLANGVEMPWLGLGTWKASEGGEVEQAIQWALELGYRSIDTASAYNNERGVGSAIRDSGIPRNEIFVTTKLWNDDQGYDQALRAFDESLRRLGLDYVDLYLIHWPVRGKVHDSWRALEQIYKEERARAIGVSNFMQHHLQHLLEQAQIQPTVNQIEFHPELQSPELFQFCHDRQIRIEAWSPLIRGKVFEIPALQEIAAKYSKTPGQITLRWQLQRGVVTIPKSVTREHIESNAGLFDFHLEADDMSRIDDLNKDQRMGPDPDTFAW